MSRRRKKPTLKGKKLTSAQLKKELSKFFSRHPKKRLNAKQLIKKLKLANNKDSVEYVLGALAEEGQLWPIGDGKYRLDRYAAHQKESSLHEGVVDMTRTGAAYILCDDLDDDVYVAAKNMGTALHGDRVQLSVYTPPGRRRAEGEVKKVLERATEHFVGTLHLSRKYGFVIPDRINMPVDIYVNLEDTKGAKDQEKVVVKVVKWPARPDHSPMGKITTVLGEVGSHHIEMQAILINNGFDLEFADATMEEAEQLTDELTEAEIARRRDMRGVTTFTIDPVDAKDFDDALSLEYKEDGTYEVGIHIADVTHYVKPGTALDQEAYQRSTSVYLVDRVLPMLPERLSNGLCSLRPNEDKFTFSAVFTFDKNDKLIDRWFGKTLTHSDRRFAYEEAQQVIESGEGDFAQEVLKLNQLAKKLRKKKFKNGAIAFESEEVRFELDEDGSPINLYVKERKDAHLLVEDFMLLANREVATYMHKKSKGGQEVPFVYRIHDLPDPEKVAEFARFARELGFQMETQTPRQIADSFNQLSKAAEENERLKILEPIAIRTMSKAVYTSDNIGHYGLGFKYYSHFTSPIRRYADVLAHRILFKNLDNTVRVKKDTLEEQCRHISMQERKAMDAERESVKYKQVEYIEKHIGEVFEGRINGFHDKGIFVELTANHCEGMVSFGSMEEYYTVNEGRLSAQGMRSGHTLKMGDLVKVRIVNADLSRRQIDMELADE